jgi:hypothetical protein
MPYMLECALMIKPWSLNFAICNYTKFCASTSYHETTPSWIILNIYIDSSYVLNKPLTKCIVGGMGNLEATIK